MSLWEMLVEGLVEDAPVEGPSDEDMAWYLEASYVDPMERVDW
jgi:hypothetical protein